MGDEKIWVMVESDKALHPLAHFNGKLVIFMPPKIPSVGNMAEIVVNREESGVIFAIWTGNLKKPELK